MTKPLIISFSGGRTSAYMAYLILNDSEMLQKYEPFLVFANTGCEHEKRWNLYIVLKCFLNGQLSG